MNTLALVNFFGIFGMAFGVAVFLNKNQYVGLMKELKNSRGLQITFAFIPLVMGAFLVSFHNIWGEGGLAVTVTVIGWLFLLGGIFRLWFPKLWVNIAEKMVNYEKFLPVLGLLITVLGALLFILGR